jgi:hypothetical protein
LPTPSTTLLEYESGTYRFASRNCSQLKSVCLTGAEASEEMRREASPSQANQRSLQIDRLLPVPERDRSSAEFLGAAIRKKALVSLHSDYDSLI